MRLEDYLEESGETYMSLARRSRVGHSTLHRIVKEPTNVPRLDTCMKIVTATGGRVRLEDLMPLSEARPASGR